MEIPRICEIWEVWSVSDRTAFCVYFGTNTQTFQIVVCSMLTWQQMILQNVRDLFRASRSIEIWYMMNYFTVCSNVRNLSAVATRLSCGRPAFQLVASRGKRTSLELHPLHLPAAGYKLLANPLLPKATCTTAQKFLSWSALTTCLQKKKNGAPRGPGPRKMRC